MKRGWKIAGIALMVAILGVAAVGAVASAQDNGTGGPFDLATKFKEALAGILGISVDDYNAAVDKAQQQVLDEAVTDGVLTEDQAEKMQERLAEQPGAGMMGPGMRGGRGMGMGMSGRGMMGGMGGSRLLTTAADKLGMSLDDLQTALQDGKTIAGLAEEKGVDIQTIIDAYLAEVKSDLDEAVADGKITQEQADEQLEQAKTQVTDRLSNTWQNMGPGRGGRRGCPANDAGDAETEDS
jgi:polyhydroxyalkanoate synthesis regulator phasin